MDAQKPDNGARRRRSPGNVGPNLPARQPWCASPNAASRRCTTRGRQRIWVNCSDPDSPTDLLVIARDMQRAGAGIRSLAEPFLDDRHGNVIAGHGRLLAAQELGRIEVPTLCLGDRGVVD